jgi:lysozyme family protein
MSDFDKSFNFVLKIEGGFTDDAADSGGETNLGITHEEYDRYRLKHGLPTQSIRLISMQEARDIYLQSYWVEGKCTAMEWPVSLAHFDACVNTGNRQAAKLLQRAIGAKDDGMIGPMTLQKLSEECENDGTIAVALHIADKRRDFYGALTEQEPSQMCFLKGWLNRVRALEREVSNAS